MVELLNQTEEKTATHTVRTVDISRFLNAGNDPDRVDGVDKYIRVFVDPNRRELRAYRKVDETDDYEPLYWRCVVEDVGLKVKHPRDEDRSAPDRYNLHSMDAETFETFLASMKASRADTQVMFEYWYKNNSPAIDESRVNHETINLSWDNGSRKHTLQINNVYSNPTGMMASWD